MVEAAYVGNYGYDIEIVRNINALPNQYLNTDNSRTAAMDANNSFLTGAVANPFAGLLPGTSFNNPTIARIQLMRPYPQFGDIRTTNNDGKSWYNSAQVGLQKRFSQGYTLGLSYTYSHWEQATEYLNPADAEPTRMISDLDVPHRLSVSGIFELPFGKGRRFLSDARRVPERARRRLAGPGRLHLPERLPRPVRDLQRHHRSHLGDLFYNGGDIAIDERTTAEWFNTDAFTSILNGTSTNATPVNHLRTLPYRFDDVRRDSINNVDLSLIKDIQLKDDVKVQLRAEFINAFNEAYFPQPGVGADVHDVRAGHGLEPGELRPPRPDRREGRVLAVARLRPGSGGPQGSPDPGASARPREATALVGPDATACSRLEQRPLTARPEGGIRHAP